MVFVLCIVNMIFRFVWLIESKISLFYYTFYRRDGTNLIGKLTFIWKKKQNQKWEEIRRREKKLYVGKQMLEY